MPKAKTKKPVAKKTIKKAVKKVVKKIISPMVKKGKPVGKVTHYYGHIKVGVIKLASPLKVGDEIRILGGENTDFSQKISSMQIDHEKISKAKKGDAVGLKVSKKVREGYKVYKI